MSDFVVLDTQYNQIDKWERHDNELIISTSCLLWLKRKDMTSKIWEHFNTKVAQDSAQCNHFQKKIKYTDGSPTFLLRYLHIKMFTH